MVREVIQVFLLLLSNLGYWEFFRTKHKINLYCVPVFVVAVQFLVLLAAGILNFLLEASVLMYFSGLFLFAKSVRREKSGFLSKYGTVGYFWFMCMLLVAGCLVYGKQVSQIDNFTHWTTVVRSMLTTNRFPTAKDTAVSFVSYPLGSSAFLYYVCKMTKETEYMQMWAQAYMIFSAILPLFACVRKNTVVGTSLIAVMAGFFISYNIPLTELLVDTLMPLAGMATALFIGIHCIADTEEKHSPYYAIPLLVWTMQIKHAAILYALFAFVLLITGTGRDRNQTKKCLNVGIALLLIRELWSRHCDYVFDTVASSTHSMSLEWFRQVLNDKSLENISFTVKRLIVYILMRREYLWLFAWVLLLGLLMWFFDRGKKRSYFAFLIGGIVLYGTYSLGILGTYVFSMPEYEALASFERYMQSVDIALYYILMVFALQMLSDFEHKILPAAAGTMILLASAGWFFQTGNYGKMHLIRCEEADRARIEQPFRDNSIEMQRSYLLCISSEDDPYEVRFPMYLWRYQMQSAAVSQRIITEPEQLHDAGNYDYVIILDQANPVIEQWIQENNPDAADSSVIRNYR